MGSDTAGQLHTWHGIDAVKSRASLVIWPRKGLPLRDLPGWQVRHLDVPRLQISGALLRERVAAGQPIDWLVPTPAVRIIRELGLYHQTRASVPSTWDLRPCTDAG
jgi:nicotinic acid mononucleotide adenylyltransferase